MQDMHPQEPTMNQLPNGEVDQEGAMAKADLYKLANYSFKLFKKLGDDDQLEAWVQAKITKAADYIASVYHYLEYEMEFSEYGSKLDNSEMYSESQKVAIKNKLMEAKAKVAELKKVQAEKLDKDEKAKKVDEGHIFGGHEQACTECGGTGMVHVPEREVPSHVKSKIKTYNRQAKAFHAASKRLDKNHNGIPDDLEDTDMEEGFEAGDKPGKSFKTRTGVATKTSGGMVHKNTSFNDEEHGQVASTVKAKSASEKKADKSNDIKLPKHSGNTWGMKNSEKFGNGAKPAKKEKEEEVEEGQGGGNMYGQGVYEGKGKKPDFLDMDKDGNKKEPMKKAVADKKKNPFAKKVDEAKEKEPEGTYSSKRHETDGQRIARLAKEKMQAKKKAEAEKVSEALKGKQKKLDVDQDGDIEADDLADLRAKKKVAEAKKPSAGLTKAQKSATVKSAKKGEDIGKPGKSFDKVAKAAGGGEKGEKIAAAAMWKAKSKAAVKEAIARVKNEGAFDAIGKAASSAGTALGFDTEENLSKKSPQLAALIALRKSPEYANDPAKMKSLEDRITKQKDRVSLDKGEVVGNDGQPVVVKESAELNRMKEFLTRLNG